MHASISPTTQLSQTQRPSPFCVGLCLFWGTPRAELSLRSQANFICSLYMFVLVHCLVIVFARLEFWEGIMK